MFTSSHLLCISCHSKMVLSLKLVTINDVFRRSNLKCKEDPRSYERNLCSWEKKA